MTEKTKQIIFGMSKIQEILNNIRPGNTWEIAYDNPERVPLSDWDRNYHNLIDGEDYFFIWQDKKLLYTIDVTGDSVLTALWELMEKLAKKF